LQIQDYKINLKKAVNRINEKKYRRVCLQIPEGLKSKSFEIVDFIKNHTHAEVIISADPCFGACDISDYKFNNLNIDFILHVGHVEIPNLSYKSIDTLFLNAITDLDVGIVLKKAIEKIEGKKIGLITTAQHLHKLDEIKEILIKNNFVPKIGKGDKRISKDGLILGCNFSSAESIQDEIDSFLFIGSGNFHPLGLMINTDKPVISADPYTKQVKKQELNDMKDAILRQRYGAITRSKNAKVFGVLIGAKKGQIRNKMASKVKDTLEKKNKKFYIITLDFFSPTSLEGFLDIGCFINTSCPRITIDDYLSYKKPIITPIELDIVLGIKKWDDYRFDEIISK